MFKILYGSILECFSEFSEFCYSKKVVKCQKLDFVKMPFQNNLPFTLSMVPNFWNLYLLLFDTSLTILFIQDAVYVSNRSTLIQFTLGSYSQPLTTEVDPYVSMRKSINRLCGTSYSTQRGNLKIPRVSELFDTISCPTTAARGLGIPPGPPAAQPWVHYGQANY